jgi:hypothetical protein
LAVAVLVLPALAQAQERRVSRARGTPIRDAIDRVVEQVVLAHTAPCELARRKGVPCFPSGIENQGPRFSVAEALRSYRGTGSPAPGVPTLAEIQGQMSGAPQSASGGVGVDPVCTLKHVWKKLNGKGTTYHLYKTWDERGERPLMTDHLLDPEDYRSNPQFHFEYVGEYSGECAAVAAWNKALREAVNPRPAEPES